MKNTKDLAQEMCITERHVSNLRARAEKALGRKLGVKRSKQTFFSEEEVQLMWDIREGIAPIPLADGENSEQVFSIELAASLLDATEPFPVDFDDAWHWLGYSTKQMAQKKLLNNFESGNDFLIERFPEPQVTGRPLEKLYLTIDCFKSLGMMAGTERGKQVRRYFLDCERVAKVLTGKLAADIAEMRADQAEIKQALQQLAAAQAVLPGGQLVPPESFVTEADIRRQNWREIEALKKPGTYTNINIGVTKNLLHWDERLAARRKYKNSEHIQQRCSELKQRPRTPLDDLLERKHKNREQLWGDED
ncbi:hypothetical protein [Stenomitos frigidus]|uniref:hypothetical protein n=1 Tax=Stenomitos frigidus TaxID=1886765 RepID=UPI0015E68AD2|nr:hypothetical protein [Stenomitos frigidus]